MPKAKTPKFDCPRADSCDLARVMRAGFSRLERRIDAMDIEMRKTKADLSNRITIVDEREQEWLRELANAEELGRKVAQAARDEIRNVIHYELSLVKDSRR